MTVTDTVKPLALKALQENLQLQILTRLRVLFPVSFAGIIIDGIYQYVRLRDSFNSSLQIRLGLLLGLLLLHLLSYLKPVQRMVFGLVLATALITSVSFEIAILKGANFYSPTQLGLAFLIIGLGLLLPLSVAQAGMVCVVVIGTFVIGGWIYTANGFIDISVLGSNLPYLIWVSLIIATVVVLVASWANTHLRTQAIISQHESEYINRRFQDKLQTLQALYQQIGQARRRADDLLNVVIPLGAALSAERDWGRLLERIMLESRKLCHADAGSLYLRNRNEQLEFVVVTNSSLGIHMGGSSENPIALPPVPLFDESGKPNHSNIASYSTLMGQTINIADAYNAKNFVFSGTIAFDQQTGYRSKSFLAIPLKNNSGKVIGVLQLINALQPGSDKVVPFDEELQQLVESLSTLAAAALDGYLREQKLHQEINQLRIELDEARRDRQVEELTGTDYFQQLRSKANQLRKKHKS